MFRANLYVRPEESPLDFGDKPRYQRRIHIDAILYKKLFSKSDLRDRTGRMRTFMWKSPNSNDGRNVDAGGSFISPYKTLLYGALPTGVCTRRVGPHGFGNGPLAMGLSSSAPRQGRDCLLRPQPLVRT